MGLWMLATPTWSLVAATDPATPIPVATERSGGNVSLASSLGVRFIPGSSTTLLIDRNGTTFVVDLARQTIQVRASSSATAPGQAIQLASMHSPPQEAPSGAKIFAARCTACHGPEGKGGGAMKTPDFTNPAVQAALPLDAVIKVVREGKPGTAMPAWRESLSDEEIKAVAAFVRSLGQVKKPEGGTSGGEAMQRVKAYEPADDYLFSLPTGRRLDRHGFYLNFTHRFVYTPAFTGPGNLNTMFGLDDFSISSFGLRYGVTNKFYVSAYRSPSLIGRPIELMAAYHFADEHNGSLMDATVRASVDGQSDFRNNFTTNLEMIVSRTVTRHSQLYFVPTLSLQNRELITKPGTLASTQPNLPGINTFSLGAGGVLDIRPTVALVAEVIPTLVNGSELGIHRPAYAFGIQKRVLRHAFTLGFTTSPGTTVSQRAGTRATFVGDPSGDTPSGLFIGFDLMRQIY